MLNVIFTECHKWALYAERRYAECRYAECCYAECCYAECRGACTGTVSTTIYFLRNLWIGQKSLRVYPWPAFMLSVLKHSSLLGPFVNCEENELLWIWSQFPQCFQSLQKKIEFVNVFFFYFIFRPVYFIPKLPFYWHQLLVWSCKTFFLLVKILLRSSRYIHHNGH